MLGSVLKQLSAALVHRAHTSIARFFHLPPPTPLMLGGLRRLKPEPINISRLSDRVGLDPQYAARVTWPVYRQGCVPPELASDPLFQIWSEIEGGTKWAHYFPVYQDLFGAFRTLPVKILEIGVFQGASLKLWRRYFQHPMTKIVGIDIQPLSAQYDAPDQGIHVHIGDQTDNAFLTKVLQEHGPFDLIIDDGSHISSHIIHSFNALFANGLKDSGIYFVEDLHANYWADWRDSRRTFFDICREIIDHMHSHYREAQLNDFRIQLHDTELNTLSVPLISTLVREIRFFDSIAVVYKSRTPHVPFWLLSEDVKALHSSRSPSK